MMMIIIMLSTSDRLDLHTQVSLYCLYLTPYLCHLKEHVREKVGGKVECGKPSRLPQ